jgi:hypothetical protein
LTERHGSQFAWNVFTDLISFPRRAEPSKTIRLPIQGYGWLGKLHLVDSRPRGCVWAAASVPQLVLGDSSTTYCASHT